MPPNKTKVASVVSVKPQALSQVEQHAKSSSLLDGAYDEANSAKSFQEALTEWRGRRGVAPSKESNTSTMKGDYIISFTR